MKRVLLVIRQQWQQPYFPFLLAWFPALSLYVHNLSEVTVSVLVVPLAYVTVLTCLVFIVSKIIVGSWGKAGVLTAFIVSAFLDYGWLVSWYPFGSLSLAGFSLSANKVLIPLLLVLIAAVAWWLRRARWGMARWIPIFNVLAIALIAQTVSQIGWSQITRAMAGHPVMAQSVDTVMNGAAATPVLGYKPDVYYIIFDRYANQHTLADDYQFDNSAFISALQDRGFYVADKAAANYPYTPLSLSSSLNMSYIDRVPESAYPYPELATSIFPTLQDTQVDQLFHRLGYTTYQMGSWFSPTHTNRAAVNYVSANFLHMDPFANQFASGTMLTPLLQGGGLPSAQSLTFDSQHLSNFEYQVKTFPQVAALPGPKFVFVHMLMPHPPYVVDNRCQPLPFGFDDTRTERENYIDQVGCTNRQALAMVQTILNASAQKPVIILQSDEGPYTIKYKMKDSVEFKNASNDSILERSRILNAYYLPDRDTSQLYPSITPVNSFRMLFRQYYGLDYPRLDDQTFVPPSRPKVLSFMDVTGVIKGWQADKD